MFREYRRNEETGQYETVDKVTATGLPMRNDVVERFKRGLRGKSGEFTTNGYIIQSYDWVLARRAPDGTITWGERMYDKPYSNTTSGHMSSVYNGLRDLVKDNAVPQDKIVHGGACIVGSVRNLDSTKQMREILRHNRNYYFTYPEEPMFVEARKQIVEQANSEIKRAKAAKMYTPKSIRAYIAALEAIKAWALGVIDEYEARIDKRGDRYKPKPHGITLPLLQRRKAKPFGREKAILSWHLLDETKRLRYGDDREVTVGSVLDVSGELVMCGHGLHGSRLLADAFSWHSGPIITRVLQYGAIQEMTGTPAKVVSQFRECIGMVDCREHERNLGYETVEQYEERVLQLMGLTRESKEAPKEVKA